MRYLREMKLHIGVGLEPVLVLLLGVVELQISPGADDA